MTFNGMDLNDVLLYVLIDEDARVEEVLEARRNCLTLVRSDLNSSRNALTEHLNTVYAHMSKCSAEDSYDWRKLYTDVSIALAILSVKIAHSTSTEDAELAVSQLDKAIIFSGAPGKGRHDLVLELIASIQADHLPSNLTADDDTYLSEIPADYPLILTAKAEVPFLETPPPFTSFVSTLSKRPFVLSGFAKDWPALRERSWSSPVYLRSIAGRARQVPIEIGGDYRTDDWTQKLMSFDEFLHKLIEFNPSDDVLYLAQHDLFKQFPALADDISTPDYVYASLEANDDYPDYRPPGNEDQLIMNVWLGPKGAVSPAHTDPFHNFYTQIVGCKTVWLAPPSCSPHMSAYGASSDQPHNPAANKEDASMSNTSRVDIFADETTVRIRHPEFWEHVVSEAMSVTLKPGDMLYFPAGWWHAMRSETTSFSVSMWF